MWIGPKDPSNNYPGKRPQTVWGSGRIMYDNVDHHDDDDDHDEEMRRRMRIRMRMKAIFCER